MYSSIINIINDIQNNKLDITNTKVKQNKKYTKKYDIESQSNSKNVIKNVIKKNES